MAADRIMRIDDCGMRFQYSFKTLMYKGNRNMFLKRMMLIKFNGHSFVLKATSGNSTTSGYS